MSNQYTKGDEFNNWTVLAFAGRNKKGEQLYQCQCICGTIREIRRDNLGKVMGCGCVRRTYKERTASPALPKKIKIQNAEVKAKKPKIIKATKCRSAFMPTNKPHATKNESEQVSTNQLIARKLEDMQLAKELESHYSLNY